MLFATQLQVIQSTVPPNLELTIITASVIGGVSILGGTGHGDRLDAGRHPLCPSARR
jgi:ribose/xylose/arabinose/galactoside ABC-type transport system permease subunit